MKCGICESGAYCEIHDDWDPLLWVTNTNTNQKTSKIQDQQGGNVREERSLDLLHQETDRIVAQLVGMSQAFLGAPLVGQETSWTLTTKTRTGSTTTQVTLSSSAGLAISSTTVLPEQGRTQSWQMNNHNEATGI